MAISTYGIQLRWGESAEAVAKVVDIKDFPDLLGEVNQLETTHLMDEAQTFIPGIRQSSTLAFTVNYTAADFKAVKDQEGTELFYELSFSDGSKFTWKGQHTCGLAGKGVDEVVEFTVNISPSTPVEFAVSE